jgi:hypothetical protein
MPPRVRVIHPDQEILVPGRVGRTLQSEVDREAVPRHVTLGTRDVPYAEETRESQAKTLVTPLVAGGVVTLATLRRAWELIGFAIDPGNAAGAGLNVTLRVLGRGVQGVITTIAVTGAQGPQAFIGFLVGARCELVVSNTSEATISGIKGEIWGMAQR